MVAGTLNAVGTGPQTLRCMETKVGGRESPPKPPKFERIE